MVYIVVITVFTGTVLFVALSVHPGSLYRYR